MSITEADIGGQVPEEWIDAVNERLNALYHEDLCNCADWPEGCATGYIPGQWDSSTAAMVAAVVLEPLIRADIAAEPQGSISTSQAADILGVSRPTVVSLLDAGALPYTRPGFHRRLELSDVLAYKKQTTHGKEAA